MSAHHKTDIEGLTFVTERVEVAREVYNDLCRSLAHEVHMLLAGAEE